MSHSPSLSAPLWHYWREPHPHIQELSLAQGAHVGLPLHFHQEDQLAYIISGRRHFFITGQHVTLDKGHALLIPANTPHVSCDDLASPPHQGEQTRCLNLYLTPHLYVAPIDCAQIIQHVVGQCPVKVQHLTHLPPSPPIEDILTSHSIQTIAQRSNMSREAYSRRFRRLYGLAPQEFRLLHQLNRAKTQLRTGASTLHAAMDAGFADQSHMGRLFRRTFGTTPGRYRAGPLQRFSSSS